VLWKIDTQHTYAEVTIQHISKSVLLYGKQQFVVTYSLSLIMVI